MFNLPIRHTPLASFEELLEFSHRTSTRSEKQKIFWQNNGQIAFVDQYGFVRVTPYRSETHDILKGEGYVEGSLFVPFSNGEERPEDYRWLYKIAEQENWAITFEEAQKIASEKGIKTFNLHTSDLKIKDITHSYYVDEDLNLQFRPLCMMFLHNNSKENIGTYILIDEKTVIICDEFGRTFLVKAKTLINSFVNALISSGYTRTRHPEWYVEEAR